MGAIIPYSKWSDKMRYKIVTDTNEYIVTESENAIVIETHNSLQDFLLDLYNTDEPKITNVIEGNNQK